MKPTEHIEFEDKKVAVRTAIISENDFPITPALAAKDCALAVIVGVEGPSYRRCGSMMVVDAQARSWGNLSSGCIDKSVALNAKNAIENRKTIVVRYGEGSPFWDAPLPCGGALDIQIFPCPDKQILENIGFKLKEREPAFITFEHDGVLSLNSTGRGLHLTILPQIRLLVFGTGMETICFAELAKAAGCRVEVFSPDQDVLTRIPHASPMVTYSWPHNVNVDERTAVVTFFHDHDREPTILMQALNSPAFFVGAQGSKRAHERRCEELIARGSSSEQLAKLVFPLGLIPSTRDPHTLGVSALAHILQYVKNDEIWRTEQLHPVTIDA